MRVSQILGVAAKKAREGALEPAANTQGVSDAIEKLKANHLDFLECGGATLSDE